MKIGKKTHIHFHIFKQWRTTKSGKIKAFNADCYLIPTLEVGYNCDNFSSIRKSLEIIFRFLFWSIGIMIDKYE